MIPISSLPHRDAFGFWLEQKGYRGVGVEVGSLCGDYAREIKKHWSGTLVMVDPWERQPDSVYREPTNRTDWASAYKSCEAIKTQHPEKVFLHRAYSPDAAKEYRDGELDFVYLDGRHDYEAVKADFIAWYPKVKSGGIFCGHDARVEHNETQCCDVLTVLNEFCAETGLKAHITNAPGCGSFWIVKP